MTDQPTPIEKPTVEDRFTCAGREFGQVAAVTRRFRDGRDAAISVAAIRAVLADYEAQQLQLPEHSEEDVAVFIVPVGHTDHPRRVGWYLNLDDAAVVLR